MTELLCLVFVSPQWYTITVRAIETLTLTQIVFELLGEETFTTWAEKLLETRQRMLAWRLPERILAAGKYYLGWVGFVALAIGELVRQILGWFSSPIEMFKEYRSANENKARVAAMRKELQAIDDGDPLGRLQKSRKQQDAYLMEMRHQPFSRLAQDEGYSWQHNLILAAVTILLIASLIAAFPSIGALIESLSTAIFTPADNSAPPTALDTLFSAVYSLLFIALALLALGAAIFVLSWLLQVLASGVFRLVQFVLERVARLLAHRKLFRMMLITTLTLSLITIWLPDGLICN